MSDYESLVWSQQRHVATVTLDRPEKKNAMSWVMFRELKEVFDRAGNDDAIRCLVVTGAGDAFCSGADLTDPENQVTTAFEMKDRMRFVDQVASSVINCPVPTIARVTGIAAGAGCNIALGCDIVVASEEASFAELFVKRGLVVDFGGSWALTRNLPLHFAKELALLGDTLSAREALAMGLINRVGNIEEVDAMVQDFSQRLASLPPRTVQLIKDNMNRASERTIEGTLEAEAMTQSLCIGSDDTKEAVIAWVQKREPKFTGR